MSTWNRMKKKRMTQVNRIVKIGIVQRMALHVHRHQKIRYCTFTHAQRSSLADDRSHRKRLLQHRFECPPHLAAHTQQCIVVIIGQRGLPAGKHVRFKIGRNDQIPVDFFLLRGFAGRLLIGEMCGHRKSRHSFHRTRDVARGSAPVQIDDSYRNALHLS